MFKKTLLALSAICILVSSSAATAQSIFEDTAFYYKASLSPVMGRDFWFTPPAMFQAQGKFYDLCVTSPKNALVNLQCGTFSTSISVKAGVTTAYLLPLTHEITSSGITEDNCAYHVWCDTADLDLMLVADNPTGGSVIENVIVEHIAVYKALVSSDIPGKIQKIIDGV